MKEDKINSGLIMKSLFIVGIVFILSVLIFAPIVFVDVNALNEFETIKNDIGIKLLIFLAIVDSVLIFLINYRNPSLENDYFKFHKKHGILLTTAIKLFLVVFVIYTMQASVIGSGGFLIAILCYAVVLIFVLYEFIRMKPNN